jgi:hypothetical protein
VKSTSGIDQTGSPPAQLRRTMSAAFNLDDIRSLCFDIGIDFDTLSGDDKNTKIIELIQSAARLGKLGDLISLCAKTRPNAGWDALARAAANDSEPFKLISAPTAAKPAQLLNIAPDRAARLGFMAGFLALFLLVCGFAGGLLAGNLLTITANPVAPNQAALDALPINVENQRFSAQSLGVKNHTTMLQSLPLALKPGINGWVEHSDETATTLLDNIVRAAPEAGLTDIHVRFLEGGSGVLNFKFGASRVLIEFRLPTENGRVRFDAQRVFIQMIDRPGSGFGWIPVPLAAVQAALDWGQLRLDEAARYWQFNRVDIGQNRMRVDFTTR